MEEVDDAAILAALEALDGAPAASTAPTVVLSTAPRSDRLVGAASIKPTVEAGDGGSGEEDHVEMLSRLAIRHRLGTHDDVVAFQQGRRYVPLAKLSQPSDATQFLGGGGGARGFQSASTAAGGADTFGRSWGVAGGISASSKADADAYETVPVMTVGVLSDVRRQTSAKGTPFLKAVFTDYRHTVDVALFRTSVDALQGQPEGTIWALRDLQMQRTGRYAGSLSLSASGNALKLGTSPVFARCTGHTKDDAPCTMAVDRSKGNRCVFHMEGQYRRLVKEMQYNRPDVSAESTYGTVVAVNKEGKPIMTRAQAIVHESEGRRRVHAPGAHTAHLAPHLHGLAPAVTGRPTPAAMSSTGGGASRIDSFAYGTAAALDTDGYGYTGDVGQGDAKRARASVAQCAGGGVAAMPQRGLHMLAAAGAGGLLNTAGRRSNLASPFPSSHPHTAPHSTLIPTARLVGGVHDGGAAAVGTKRPRVEGGVPLSSRIPMGPASAPAPTHTTGGVANTKPVASPPSAPHGRCMSWEGGGGVMTEDHRRECLGALLDGILPPGGRSSGGKAQVGADRAGGQVFAEVLAAERAAEARSNTVRARAVLAAKQQRGENMDDGANRRVAATAPLVCAIRPTLAPASHTPGGVRGTSPTILHGGGASGGGGSGGPPSKPVLALGSKHAEAALRMSSLHANEAVEARMEALRDRMDKAERVEEMEAAMMEVNTRTVTRWFCLACEKWYDRPPGMCEKEGHPIQSAKKKQYAMQCGHCSRKSHGYTWPCYEPCSNCNKIAWSLTSIYRLLTGGYTDDVSLDPTAKLLPTGEAVENSLRHGGLVHAGAADDVSGVGM